MKTLNNKIIALLNSSFDTENVETFRIPPQRTGFAFMMDQNDQYTFIITDKCVSGCKTDNILSAISDVAIPAMKNSPNKEILLKSDLTVSISNHID